MRWSGVASAVPSVSADHEPCSPVPFVLTRSARRALTVYSSGVFTFANAAVCERNRSDLKMTSSTLRTWPRGEFVSQASMHWRTRSASGVSCGAVKS